MDELNRLFHTLAPWLFGFLAFGTVFAALAVVKYYLDLRQAAFFILRRRTQGRLRISLLAMIVLAVLTAAVTIGQDSIPVPPPVEEEITTELTLTTTSAPSRAARQEPTATPTATATRGATATAPFIPTNTPSITPSSTPTRTPTPTPSSTPTPSLTPTVTPTPSITPTPSPTIPILEAIATPVEPFATVPAGAEIQELTVSTGVEVNSSPINPGDTFLEGQTGLYVSFRYDNMVDGVLWRHVWLRDGALYGGATLVWEWGERGRSVFYLRPEGGFDPGRYEVQVMLEDEVVQTIEFTIE